jgi:serine/threonine protein kinase
LAFFQMDQRRASEPKGSSTPQLGQYVLSVSHDGLFVDGNKITDVVVHDIPLTDPSSAQPGSPHVPIAGRSPLTRSVLQSIVIPATVQTISADCFATCPTLTEVTFAANSNLKCILSRAFASTALSLISLPPSVQFVGSYCFSGCKSLTSVEVPPALDAIETGTFSGAGLNAILIPRNIQIIGELSFFECTSLQEVEIVPDSKLTRIEKCAFTATSLHAISLPVSLECIGSGCFMDCAELVEVTLAVPAVSDADGIFTFQSHLKQIADSVFLGTNLATVYLPTTVEQVDGRAFPYDCIVHVLGCEMSARDLGWVNGCPPARSAVSRRPSQRDSWKLPIDDLRRKDRLDGGVSSAVALYDCNKGKLAGKQVKKECTPPEWFEREIDLLIRLDHPCIVRFAGFTPAGDNEPNLHGTIFMDFAKEGSLEGLFEQQQKRDRTKKTVDATQKAIIILGIALGLNFIHAAGVVHRDIKPPNVLLNSDLHPMICDFGCARFAGVNMTAGIGSYSWKAPEMMDSNEEDIAYTNKVDIWAFGLVMYQILFDGSLWPRDIESNIGRLRKGILNGRRPVIKEDPKRKWVADLMQKCWQRIPDDRPGMPEILATLKSKKFDVLEGVNSEKVMEYFSWVEENRAK